MGNSTRDTIRIKLQQSIDAQKKSIDLLREVHEMLEDQKPDHADFLYTVIQGSITARELTTTFRENV